MRCCKNEYLDTSEAAGVGWLLNLSLKDSTDIMAKSVTKILKFADKNADQQNYTFKFAKQNSLLSIFP